MKKKFSFSPISLILWGWLFFVMSPLVAMSYIFAILIHEFGHFFVAKKLGYQMLGFSLSPYGVALAMKDKTMLSNDEIKIALAGPMVNLLTSFFVVAIWWLFPATYNFLNDFVFISVSLALVNLLPAYPLDGGRVFVCLVGEKVGRKKAKKIAVFFNFVVASLFLVLFVIMLFVNFNPTFLLFSIFLFGGMMELKNGSKYEKINLFLKKKKRFSKPQIFCVFGDETILELLKKMECSKPVLFCYILSGGKVVNLSEDMVLKFSLNFAPDTKLKDVFNFHNPISKKE